MSDLATAAKGITARDWKPFQRLAIKRMQRQGLVDRATARKLQKMPRGEFLEWLRDGGFEEILDFIMRLIELFSAFAV